MAAHTINVALISRSRASLITSSNLLWSILLSNRLNPCLTAMGDCHWPQNGGSVHLSVTENKIAVSELFLQYVEMPESIVRTQVVHPVLNVTIYRLSIITGLDYWNGLLEWTTGLTFFCTKNHFYGLYNEIPLPVKPHPAISNSINYPTAQDHKKQT